MLETVFGVVFVDHEVSSLVDHLPAYRGDAARNFEAGQHPILVSSEAINRVGRDLERQLPSILHPDFGF